MNIQRAIAFRDVFGDRALNVGDLQKAAEAFARIRKDSSLFLSLPTSSYDFRTANLALFI